MTYPASHSKDESEFWRGYHACKAMGVQDMPDVVRPAPIKSFQPGCPYPRLGLVVDTHA